MPIAVLVGMSTVTTIYFLTNCAYFVVLDASKFLESDAIANVTLIRQFKLTHVWEFCKRDNGQAFIFGVILCLHIDGWSGQFHRIQC